METALDPFIPSEGVRITLLVSITASGRKPVSEQPRTPIYEHALHMDRGACPRLLPVQALRHRLRRICRWRDQRKTTPRRRLSQGIDRVAGADLSPSEPNSFHHWIKERNFIGQFDTANPPSFASAAEIAAARAIRTGAGRLSRRGRLVGRGAAFRPGLRRALQARLRQVPRSAPADHTRPARAAPGNGRRPDQWLVDTSKLTARQTQIATLAAEGKNNRMIAEELQISEETIGNRMRVVFKALGVQKRADLRPLLALDLIRRRSHRATVAPRPR